MCSFKIVLKTLDLNAFTGKFYQTRKEKIPIPHKIFQKIEEERIFPNSFYEVRIIVIKKIDKDIIPRQKTIHQYLSYTYMQKSL